MIDLIPFLLDNLVRDEELIPTIFYALLNILKHNASLNRTQSLKVLSALLFNNPNIDIIIDKFASNEDEEDTNE